MIMRETPFSLRAYLYLGGGLGLLYTLGRLGNTEEWTGLVYLNAAIGGAIAAGFLYCARTMPTMLRTRKLTALYVVLWSNVARSVLITALVMAYGGSDSTGLIVWTGIAFLFAWYLQTNAIRLSKKTIL